MAKGQRITLFPKDADSPFGRRLLNLIFDICHDGDITTGEVDALHSFLVKHKSELPAAVLLRAQTREMLSDGRIDPLDAYNLKIYFVRIVPKDIRGIIETHLAAIGLPAMTDDTPRWHHDAATARQIDYIVAMGGNPPRGLTKGQASELIEALLDRRPPTPRQMMLVRFFDRMDLACCTKDEVSAWIDELFFMDMKHELAWDRFKRETRQDQFEMDPGTVPVGAFRTYMR